MIERNDDWSHDPIATTCSHAQMRFWFEEQLSPGSPALNVAARWRVNGELEHSTLEETWRRIVARHQALRTCFRPADGEPVATIESHVALSIPVVDLRAMTRARAEIEADRLARVHARTPFDLATAPLIRVTRLIISNEASIVLVAAHRAACDRTSMRVLGAEMQQIAAALGTGVAPFLVDVDADDRRPRNAASPEAGTFAGERAIVAALLHGHTPFEVLPDRPRPPRLLTRSALASKQLDPGSTDALARLARQSGCTFFSASLAALFALLSRFSGETDIVIGADVGEHEDDRERVGCFANTIALRGDISGQPDFHALLSRTHGMVSDALAARRLPLAQLVDVADFIRDSSRNALFSVNVSFEREIIPNGRDAALELVELPPVPVGVLSDIEMRMIQQPTGWRLDCEYNAHLYDASTIVRLLDCFDALLAGIAATSTTPIAHIDILSDADRRELLIIADDTRALYPSDATLPQLIDEQTARTPDAIAIVCGDVTVTYAQLDLAAERLADDLVRAGVTRPARIGILLDRSPEVVIAMLAVLKTGCTYVPLDPNHPPQRIAFIVRDGALGAVITRSAFADRGELAGTPKILVDPRAEERSDYVDRSALAPSADDLAYMIYTSGSTGRPKAVQVHHRALVNLLWAMRARPGLNESDTLVAVTTISFDIAQLDLFLPLITGAKLVIASEADCVDGRALIRLLDRVGATFVQATPATWQLLIEAGWTGDSRMVILCGGEAIPRPLAEELLDRGSELWNMYGPTETTIYSSARQVERGSGPVYIGPPIANTQFYVVDANQKRVPPGVTGELWIGGDGVARGYYGRPDLTAERFVDDPFGTNANAKLYRTGDIVRTRASGCIEFLGRSDHQVKVRGFRIELDEIAAVLLAQPGVADAVVTAENDRTGQPVIRAYVVETRDAKREPTRWTATLRARIGEFLPKYMLPATITAIDALPRTPNGKLDRVALPRTLDMLETTSRRNDLPATATEAIVVKIVMELLDRPHIGRHDDLFAIGLHSLLVMRLIARFAQTIAIELPVRAVFENPTVAGVALHIDRVTGSEHKTLTPATRPIVTYHDGGDEPPFIYFHNDDVADGIHCRPLAAALGPATPFIAIAPYGHAGLPFLTTIEAMAHDALSRLDALGIAGPYRMGGFCSGAFVALELARLLRARGETVESVIIINAHAPSPRAFPGVDALIRRIGLDVRMNSYTRERVCLNMARATMCIDRGPATVARFIAERFHTLISLEDRQRRYSSANPYLPEQRAGTPQTEAGLARIVADSTYHPAPYDGEITLIWSREEEPLMGDPMRGDPILGWGAISDRVEIIPIDGQHYSPIRENINELGAIIARIFASQRSSTRAAIPVSTPFSNDQEGH